MGKHVLVVFNDLVEQRHWVDELRMNGHDVTAVTNAFEAWAEVTSDVWFEQIVCGMSLPGMSGLQLLRQIRAGSCQPNIPFALLSGAPTVPGHENSDLRVICKMLEADFFLTPDWEIPEKLCLVGPRKVSKKHH